MKFATLALLIASVSAIKIHGDGTPQNQLDYWAREKQIAKDNADAAAKAAADAAAAKADAAATKAAAAHAADLNSQSGRVWANIKDTNAQNMHPETLKNQPPSSMANEGMIEERDFKTSASDISDNTHTGEHWDGPKRGRIIREYRRALDQCNISGTGKCTKEALGKNYPAESK